MKCAKCNKQIPSVSTICPYCSTPVENSSDGAINFGDIEDINYDQKNELKTYIPEPEKHKSRKIIILSIVVIGTLIAGILIFMMRSKSEKLDKYFMSTLENVKSTIDKNIFNNDIKSGDYELSISVNGDNHEFQGHYARDNKNQIIAINGIKLEEASGVILDREELSFNAYIENDDLYFKSNKLMDSYIKYRINSKIGLMGDNKIINKLYNEIKDTLKNVDYHVENVDINYRGIQTSTKKYYFILDNNKRLEFIKNFYDSLKNDEEFIKYYAESNALTKEEIVENINQRLEEAENKYSNKSNNILFALYVNNKNIIRYYIEDTIDDKHYVYQLDFKDNKYFFDYFIDNVNIISATLIKTEENIDQQKVINYSITFDTDDNVRDIVINFKPDNEIKFAKEEISEYVQYQDILDEEKLLLKNNLIPYINIKIIDDFLKLLK